MTEWTGITGTVMAALLCLVGGVTQASGLQFPTRQPLCQELQPFKLCQNLSYHWTSMPNYAGQNDQEEAALVAMQFSPLLKIECSPYLQPLVCFVFFPVCHQKMGRLAPCPWMCEEARKGCEPVMRQFGFQWPEVMSCDRFPKDKLCVDPEQPQPSNAPAVRPPSRCKKIRWPACQKVGYRSTGMPNWAGQDKVADAELELQQLRPLMEVKCSPDATAFFCAVYLPKCERGVVLPPCRRLCLSAKSGCEPLMAKFGFPWPETWDCERFPSTRCTDVASV